MAATLPTFIIIGAAKAGTTSLWRYLKNHPDVYMCSPKEPNFFAYHQPWTLGVEWYGSLFERGAGAKAIGEASPAYSLYPMYPWVPKRMHRIVPEVRLVYSIRNPIDRMISLYRHRIDVKQESKPIDEALSSDPLYLESSKYAMQIEQYLFYFDRSRLMVLSVDDLAARRQETLSTLFQFIGVDPSVFPGEATVEYNVGTEHRRAFGVLEKLRSTKMHWLARRLVPTDSRLNEFLWRFVSVRSSTPIEAAQPSTETRRRLLDALRPDLENLRSYMGPGFDSWGLLEEDG